ncbi:hypothetical protein NPIL_678241 [Nephila pilipes]|uniref:Uncharacterized protein n=1 Tax=Nephila pilipes TaxID=299642 RepID=A0A8X6IFN4_NEPPI|nr:hypothetical protein NPIL_678241 [Nephila pilipes]
MIHHICSSKLPERLQLQKENVDLNVGCLSRLSTTAKSKASAVIFNEEKTFNRKLESYVVTKITNLMPSLQINLSNVTNDRNVVKVLEKENFDIHPILNDSNVTKLKVLGIQWDYQDDSLSVETALVTEVLKRKNNTKRFILQAAGKMYDPLGLIMPFTVRLKFL